MNLDDLGDFPRGSPYFGYNSAWSENPVLCIFTFQGPIRTQIDRGFFEDQYFPKYYDMRLWNQVNGARRGKEHGWRAQGGGRATYPLSTILTPFA